MFGYFNSSRFKIWGFVILLHFSVKFVVAELTEDLIPVLYLKYKDALRDGNSTVSVRRLFTDNKAYEIHVKRLKEVNGFKIHNLMVKETIRSNDNPLIYIDNPVESKLPYAYLTLEEFKSVLTNRIQVQKDELARKRQDILKINNITEKYITTKVVTKQLSTEKVTPVLLETDNIKKDVKSTLNTENIVKEKIVKDFTDVSIKELKPMVTTKYDPEKQNISSDINRNTTPNLTSTENPKDISKTLENSNVLIERYISTLKTTEFSKQHTDAEETGNISENKSSITRSDLGQTTSLKTSNASEIFNESKELHEKLTEVTKSLANKTYSASHIAITSGINATTIEINSEISTVTKEITNTKGVTRETPKRSKLLKRVKEKEKFAMTTKWKRSTLGRPMVFVE